MSSLQHQLLKQLLVAAAVPLAVGFMLVAQARRPAPPRTITITDQRLLAGNRAYLLADLAGFWLRQEKGITIVNIEPNKPSPFPVSLLHPSDNAETVRALLLQSLPEVEQRATDVTDSLGKYIKL